MHDSRYRRSAQRSKPLRYYEHERRRIDISIRRKAETAQEHEGFYGCVSFQLEDFKGTSQGTTTKFLTIKILNEIPIIVPNRDTYIVFYKEEETLFNNIFLIKQENEKLTELQSLLLAKMGR